MLSSEEKARIPSGEDCPQILGKYEGYIRAYLNAPSPDKLDSMVALMNSEKFDQCLSDSNFEEEIVKLDSLLQGL